MRRIGGGRGGGAKGGVLGAVIRGDAQAERRSNRAYPQHMYYDSFEHDKHWEEGLMVRTDVERGDACKEDRDAGGRRSPQQQSILVARPKKRGFRQLSVIQQWIQYPH